MALCVPLGVPMCDYEHIICDDYNDDVVATDNC